MLARGFGQPSLQGAAGDPLEPRAAARVRAAVPACALPLQACARAAVHYQAHTRTIRPGTDSSGLVAIR
jgi:hypothetical protein